ncbi:MAG: hypothetical protein PHH06_00570 [Candidatus Gracilibacteria bacterium]|nr:hypothetical protein [Candidatus Gracilibacteria bacterium]
MKLNKKATSIIEAMIVMLVIITGVIGMYSIYDSSTKLSASTKNRIEAIEIAREGIEAMKNIRDTNWLLFKADPDNCWNTLNYNPNCVGDDTSTNDIIAGSYIIYQDIDNRWKLNSQSGGTFGSGSYISDFRVKKDINGLYTQTGGIDFTPIFTREIKVNYPSGDSNNQKMEISSIVQWKDSSSNAPHKVELNHTLTNREN